jgi:hypothetical protein
VFYRCTTVATGMMMSSSLSLLGSIVDVGMMMSCPSLLCFSYYPLNQYKCYQMEKIIYYPLN